MLSFHFFVIVCLERRIFSTMNPFPITVTIITLNEEEKIAQALESVNWAREVIVVDSGSSDRTREIAASRGAKVIVHPWQGYGQQKNFAQSQASFDWVLNIDADEVVSPELRDEIIRVLSGLDQNGKWDARIDGSRRPHGFLIPRKTFYLGRWIQHGGWYPNYLVRLANRKLARWTEPHVHEEWRVDGDVGHLSSPLLHYAFLKIEDQILTNLRFSRLGSEDLKRKGKRHSLFKLIFKPIGKFIETFFLKCGFMDGLPGFIISVNAAHSMFLKYAYLAEAEIQNESARS